MKVGDYVLYKDDVWKVVILHKSGTIQIKTLSASWWVDNTEVKFEDVEVITKEVADVIRSVYEEGLGSKH